MKNFINKIVISFLIIVLFFGLLQEYKNVTSKKHFVLEDLHSESVKDTSNKENIERPSSISDEILYKQIKINTYKFSLDEFNSIEDVYKGIKGDDRVIFVVRHSERGPDYSKQGALTPNGIDLALNLGSKLVGEPFSDTSSDFYGSTTIKRTVETSYYIGKSRGNPTIEQFSLPGGDNREFYDKINHPIDVLIDNYFGLCAGGLYDSNPDFAISKSIELVNNLCKYTEGHPFSRLTTHDCVTIPLVERVSNGMIKFYGGDRINFMSGIAIIVHNNGFREAYPVRGLDNGKMMN